jgi:hypothetical protein
MDQPQSADLTLGSLQAKGSETEPTGQQGIDAGEFVWRLRRDIRMIWMPRRWERSAVQCSRQRRGFRRARDCCVSDDLMGYSDEG